MDTPLVLKQCVCDVVAFRFRWASRCDRALNVDRRLSTCGRLSRSLPSNVSLLLLCWRNTTGEYYFVRPTESMWIRCNAEVHSWIRLICWLSAIEIVEVGDHICYELCFCCRWFITGHIVWLTNVVHIAYYLSDKIKASRNLKSEKPVDDTCTVEPCADAPRRRRQFVGTAAADFCWSERRRR